MTSSVRLDPIRPDAPRVRRTGDAAVPTFRTPVRGHAFAAPPPGGREPGAGLAVHLVREPTNPRDTLAVAVWAADGAPWRLGYLDRAVAARLAPRLDDGQRFEVAVDGWVDAPGGRWRRPLLRVAARGSEPASGGLSTRPPGVTRRVIGSAR